MTTFEKIIKAITPFGYPHAQDEYRGTEKDAWFTYNAAGDKAVLFADNEPIEAVTDIQVHLFVPKSENYINLKNRVRRSIYEQGFTFPEVTVINEGDKRHIIFECSIEEEEF